MISYHLDASSHVRENSQYKDIDNLQIEDSHAPEDDSEIQDTITVRRPMLPLQISVLHIAEGLSITTEESSSLHQSMAQKSALLRPQRARKAVDHFKAGT